MTIALKPEQLSAIGQVALESGTLERELEEYAARLGHPHCMRGTVGPKLDFLKAILPSLPIAALAITEFEYALDALKLLINHRNVVIHGVWSPPLSAPTPIGSVSAKGRKGVVIRAEQVADLAAALHLGRALLFTLCFENCPVAIGTKRPPTRSAAQSKTRLKNAMVRSGI